MTKILRTHPERASRVAHQARSCQGGLRDPKAGRCLLFVPPGSAQAPATSITSPESRRSLAVAPLIGYQRGDGETPARLRRGSGAGRRRMWCSVGGIGGQRLGCLVSRNASTAESYADNIGYTQGCHWQCTVGAGAT